MKRLLFILLLSFSFSQDYVLNFDGQDDWVEIPNNGSMALSGEVFSIQVWYRTIGEMSAQSTTIFDHYPQPSWGQQKAWSLFIYDNENNGKAGFWYRWQEGENYEENVIFTDNRIDDGNWHHLAVERYQDGTVNLFVDGIKQSDEMQMSTEAAIDNSGNYGIGSGHHYRYQSCEVAEVILSKTNLFFDNFQPDSNFSENQYTIGHWTFNEGEGQILFDNSGNNNHGNIYGAQWVENEAGEEYPLNLFDYAGEYNGHSYYVSKGYMSVTEAIDLTNQNGGYLVTISDQAENDFITSFADEILPYTENLLLGLSEAGSIGDWYWLNGEPLTYTNWAESFNEDENYAALNPHIHNGGWVDISGAQGYAGIEFSNTEEVSGCTDEYACNPNSEATIDDGSCYYSCHDNGDYSLSFDGEDDYIDIGSNIQIDGSFSFGGWVKNNGSDYTTIASKRVYSNAYYGWHLSYEDNGVMGFYVQENSSGPPTVSTTTDQIYNEIFHVTAVFDAGNNISLYINGELAGTSATSLSSLSNNNAPLLISSLQDPGSWIWDGLIKDFFIYDDALNASDVHEIFSNTISLETNNLLGHWKFNQGSDGEYPNTLIDHSGNQNHGTIYGAEWVDNIVIGDVIQDGNINILDIIALVDIIINGLEFNPAGDLNDDGVINVLDVFALLLIVLNS